MLHLPGEAGNVLHIPSNDFVYAFFVFFCGHSFVASRLKVHFAPVLGWLGERAESEFGAPLQLLGSVLAGPPFLPHFAKCGKKVGSTMNSQRTINLEF